MPLCREVRQPLRVRYPSMRIMNIHFNRSRESLKDVRVRKAINYAIDRVGFTRVTTEGTGDVVSSLMFLWVIAYFFASWRYR